ncbi:MAG: hypothetical protein WAX89_07800 [Alphaproteobacteria bacterium]
MRVRIAFMCLILCAACSRRPDIGYVSANMPDPDEVQAYQAAFDEAQKEEIPVEAQDLPLNDIEPAAGQAPQTATGHWAEGDAGWEAGAGGANASLAASGLWGKPPASTGIGVTLADDEMRSRLNDALTTTPLNGQARWENQGLVYIFLPNSPVYMPHRSGGRCRDGVFTVYGDGFTNQKVRGLFCQTGPAADWLLLASVVE